MLYKALHNLQHGDKFFEGGKIFEEKEVIALGVPPHEHFEPFSEAEADEKNIGTSTPVDRSPVPEKAPEQQTEPQEPDAPQAPDFDQNQNKNGGDQTQEQAGNGQA